MQSIESVCVDNKPTSNLEFQEHQQNRESNARTYARRLGLAFTEAKGVLVRCADGRQYYDCLAAAGTLVLGHNHPVVLEAVQQAMNSSLPMQTLDITTPVKHQFVDDLFASLPEPFASRGRIQFCGPSGADANEAAIKLVKTATGRHGMVSFHGGYHGMTNGTLALTGNLGPREPASGLMGGVQFLPFPQNYRCPFGVGGGEASHRVASHYLEFVLSDPESGVSPAGLILEVVQGEGGVNPAPDEWLREVRRVTRERNVPLIIDEVQTGWGRTGQLYAFMQAGITPDVLVLSKAIGGGLPLSVVIYDQSLDNWQPGAHAGTFRGNQWAMAAGTATLNYILANDIPSHAEKMGQRLASHLRQIQAEFPCIGDVRGRGLMLGVEFVDHQYGKTWMGAPMPDTSLARRVQQECLRHGLIIELGGRFGAVARFLPPLIVTPEDVDAIADLFAKAVRSAVLNQKA